MSNFGLLVHPQSEFEQQVKHLLATEDEPDRSVVKLLICHQKIQGVGEAAKTTQTTFDGLVIINDKKKGKKILEISDTALHNLRSIQGGELRTKIKAGFQELIYESEVPLKERTIPFSIDSKQTIPYPYTRQCAAGIIMAFYNGSMDPLDRINSIGAALEHDAQLILITSHASPTYWKWSSLKC